MTAPSLQFLEEVRAQIKARLVWTPDPDNKPQCEAYNSEADLALFGGEPGGGKSDLLLGLALTKHERSIIFRRAYVDLRGLEERLIEIRGGRQGWNGADMVLRDADRVLEFGALDKPGAEYSWMGRPHDFIGFDEGAQLERNKVAFVLGWLRSATPGQRKRAVIATNPPLGAEGYWLVEWFAPWLDPLFDDPAGPGELRWCVTVGTEVQWVASPEPVVIDGETYTPESRTFIPSGLENNRFLRDTGYRTRLQNLEEPMRSILLRGDFTAGRQDDEFQVIPSEWIDLANDRWRAMTRPNRMDVIGVDPAGTGPDPLVMAPLYGIWFDDLIREKGVKKTNGPAVAATILTIMRDGALPVIDMTGGWGISPRDHLEAQKIEVLGVVYSEASDQKTRSSVYQYANMRSELWWGFRESLDPKMNAPENLPALPPDRRLKAQLCAPRWRPKGNRLYIESKEEVKKRLGSSTDDADAVIQAWYGRLRAMVRNLTNQHRPSGKRADPLGRYRKMSRR